MNIFRTEELSEEEIEELKELNIIPSVSGNHIPEEGDVSQETENQEGEEEKPEYEKNPETGNLIDPETGQELDPDTYEFVDPTFSLFD